MLAYSLFSQVRISFGTVIMESNWRTIVSNHGWDPPRSMNWKVFGWP